MSKRFMLRRNFDCFCHFWLKKQRCIAFSETFYWSRFQRISSLGWSTTLELQKQKHALVCAVQTISCSSAFEQHPMAQNVRQGVPNHFQHLTIKHCWACIINVVNHTFTFIIITTRSRADVDFQFILSFYIISGIQFTQSKRNAGTLTLPNHCQTIFHL